MDHELRLEALRGEQPNPEEPLLPKEFESFRKQLAHLREMARDADTKAEVIAKVVQKIAVFENGVEIFFHAGRTHFSPELADTKSPASFLSQLGQSKSPKNKTPTGKSARVKICAAHSAYNGSLVVVIESGSSFTTLL
jgi:hypothetical protein